MTGQGLAFVLLALHRALYTSWSISHHRPTDGEDLVL